jgi:ribosome-associated toxin RatA of RatAB toxin-antitoxin module
MLKYPYYEPAVKKLEKLSNKADELLNGLTAENIEERYRERNTVMIQVNNLKRQLSDKPFVCEETQYHVSSIVPLRF